MNTLTTEQAAVRLGVTPSRVRVLIRGGRLPAQKFGRAHLIKESDLKLVEDRPPGRPPGKAKQAGSAGKAATGRANAGNGPSTKQSGKKRGGKK
jgi:excisionase family DNA binding protein